MYCAIDFGTSNSAVAIPDGTGEMRMDELEDGYATLPTAVFYWVEGSEATGPPRQFGRITRAVLGQPVFFVDDDPARDATAQRARTSERPAYKP